jgi:hypothetical protein
MADQTDKNTQINDGWEICLNNIKAKERRDYSDAQEKARKDNNDDVMFPWFTRVLIKTPIKGFNPKDPNAYGELGLEDFAEVVNRINDAFRHLFKRAIE